MDDVLKVNSVAFYEPFRLDTAARARTTSAFSLVLLVFLFSRYFQGAPAHVEELRVRSLLDTVSPKKLDLEAPLCFFLPPFFRLVHIKDFLIVFRAFGRTSLALLVRRSLFS